MNHLSTILLSLALSGSAIAQTYTFPAPSSKDFSRDGKASSRVEQVFKVEDDGFEYVAYLVTYHGKKVIVEDSPSSTDYSVGDMVDFLVVRVDTSKNFPDGKKLLKFMVDDGKKHLKCWIE